MSYTDQRNAVQAIRDEFKPRPESKLFVELDRIDEMIDRAIRHEDRRAALLQEHSELELVLGTPHQHSTREVALASSTVHEIKNMIGDIDELLDGKVLPREVGQPSTFTRMSSGLKSNISTGLYTLQNTRKQLQNIERQYQDSLHMVNTQKLVPTAMMGISNKRSRIFSKWLGYESPEELTV